MLSVAPAHAVGAVSKHDAAARGGIPLWFPASVPFRRYHTQRELELAQARRLSLRDLDDYEEAYSTPLMRWPLEAPSSPACRVIRGNVSVSLVGLQSESLGDLTLQLRHGDSLLVLSNGSSVGTRVGHLLRDGDSSLRMPRQRVTHGALQQPHRARQRVLSEPPVHTFSDVSSGRLNLALGRQATASAVMLDGHASRAVDGRIGRSFSASGAALAVPRGGAPGVGQGHTSWIEVDLGAAQPISSVRLWSLDPADRDGQAEVQRVDVTCAENVTSGSFRLGMTLPSDIALATEPISITAPAMREDAGTRAEAAGSVQTALEKMLRGTLVMVSRISSGNGWAVPFLLSITFIGGGDLPQMSVPLENLELIKPSGAISGLGSVRITTEQDGRGNSGVDGSGDAVCVFPRCIGPLAGCTPSLLTQQPSWLILSNASLGDATVAEALVHPSVAWKAKALTDTLLDGVYDSPLWMTQPITARYVRLQRADSKPLVISEIQVFGTMPGSVATSQPWAHYTGPPRVPPGEYVSHSSPRVFEGGLVGSLFLLEVLLKRPTVMTGHAGHASPHAQPQAASPTFVASPSLSVLQRRMAEPSRQARRMQASSGPSAGATLAPPRQGTRAFGHDPADHRPFGYLSHWFLAFDCAADMEAGSAVTRVEVHAETRVCVTSPPHKGTVALVNGTTGVRQLSAGGAAVALGDGAVAWEGDGARYSLAADGSGGTRATAALPFSTTRHTLLYTPDALATGQDMLTYGVSLGGAGLGRGSESGSCGHFIIAGSAGVMLSTIQLELTS